MNIQPHATDTHQANTPDFVTWALAWKSRGYPPLILGGDDGKKLLVERITGYSPDDATEAEIRSWPRQFGYLKKANLGIRCPVGILGVDIDLYDGKPGARTLTALEAKYGPLPPTWITTARDDGSGIRWYRVPLGWQGHLPQDVGIELIQRHHRYAAIPPSGHKTGADYRLYEPQGHEDTSGLLPPPDQLPWLSQSWCDGLVKPPKTARAVRGRAEVMAWLEAHTNNDFPAGLGMVKKKFLSQVESGEKSTGTR